MSKFNLFNSVRVKAPKKNKFNLSHDVKLSCDMGQLVPIFCQPVVPGDRFSINSEALVRFAPLTSPVMHRVNVYMHYFFVPTRLIWSNWRDFITGGKDGRQRPSYPRLLVRNYSTNESVENNWDKQKFNTYFQPGTLADYLGFPVADKPDLFDVDPSQVIIDALPFRAYQLIYNEYYRDENLTDEVPIADGGEFDGILDNHLVTRELMTLRYRCWKKDYFTSALPWPQRGEDVELPIVGNAPVHLHTNGSSSTTPVSGGSFVDSTLSSPSGNVQQSSNGNITANGSQPLYYDPNGSLYADMSNVSSSTINELRRAMAAQKFLEVGARGGYRYIEQILSYFGVKSSDARLQRPEYLGGNKTPVMISDVMQTSESTPQSPQGTPAGNAVSLGGNHMFNRFFEEHGYIIGIMSVMPQPAYQQGMPRVFTKFEREDYYWPQFAHLGEQEINEGEIFFHVGKKSDGLINNGKNESLFGYAPRYAEYKFINSSVHGDFRTSLNFWHMGRIFDSAPRLNGDFVSFKKGSCDRVFAVEDSSVNHLWINIRNNVNAIRPMPKYGTPLL